MNGTAKCDVSSTTLPSCAQGRSDRPGRAIRCFVALGQTGPEICFIKELQAESTQQSKLANNLNQFVLIIPHHVPFLVPLSFISFSIISLSLFYHSRDLRYTRNTPNNIKRKKKCVSKDITFMECRN